MNVGFVGLGKLGLPVATCIATKGHMVKGFDINPDNMQKTCNFVETGPTGAGPFLPFLENADNLSFGTLEEVVEHSELIFLAVQTPHLPQYEGTMPIPKERVDFNYQYLIDAVERVAALIEKDTALAIISTCLPGTMQQHIIPVIEDNPFVHLVYNPSFIAMGTVMRDYMDPEFILLGTHDEYATKLITEFYETITDAEQRVMSVESAELTKVTYNTFIGMKIALANTVMELCTYLPNTDSDDVMNALKKAHRRLTGPAYLTGGMGDGGGCHPRDNIAMSYLARKTGLSFDFFEAVMLSREKQATWLAGLLHWYSSTVQLPAVILGMSFKPETEIETGSPAMLVANLIHERFGNPVVCARSVDDMPLGACVILLGCKKPEFKNYVPHTGSIVIDPFRYYEGDETHVTLTPRDVSSIVREQLQTTSVHIPLGKCPADVS